MKRAEDGHDSPCILHWSSNIHGFASTGFVLLHEKADGDIEKVEIDHSGLVLLPGEKGPLVVGAGNYFLWQLAPGKETTFVATLPERFQKVLVTGERYHLVWPGNEIDQWEWGTISEHADQELTSRSADGKSTKLKLNLHGGPSISFKVEEESEPWPVRAKREKKIGFAAANLEEEKWRQRREKTRKEQEDRPSSPKPIEPSERV